MVEPHSWKNNQFKYFSNIAGYSGVSSEEHVEISVYLSDPIKVFIGGPYPHWLFMTSRGELRLHPMGVDGAIKCFASFHNVNCSQGFLYLNRKVMLSYFNIYRHIRHFLRLFLK